MTCISITREMNKYTFTFDNGKTASVNLDNREHPFIGVSGKTIANISTSIRGIMRTILEDASYRWGSFTFKNKEYIDRVISLPNISLPIKEAYIDMIYNCNAESAWLNTEWRAIINMMKKSEQAENTRTFDLFHEIEMQKLSKIIEKYNLQECKDYIDLLHPDFLEIKAFRSALRTVCKDKYEKAQKAVMELFETENKDLLAENFGIFFKKYDTEYHVNRLYNTMERAESYRKKIGLENFVYTNIERDYINLKTTYEREKTRIDNEFFARNQERKNLSFEYGNYKIYIPKTREELNKIGDFFHNCANGWEWDSRLSGGNYALVVVTTKKEENFCICCDIDLRYMEISQYLEQYNRRPYENSLNTFRQKYQEYLNTLRTV